MYGGRRGTVRECIIIIRPRSGHPKSSREVYRTPAAAPGAAFHFRRASQPAPVRGNFLPLRGGGGRCGLGRGTGLWRLNFLPILAPLDYTKNSKYARLNA